MTKYDDTDWHSHDAQNDAYAGAHIAFFFVWLANNGYFSDEMLNSETKITTPLSTKKTPTWYLEQFGDGKLLSEFLTEDGQKFVAERYKNYINDAGIPGLIKYSRNEKIEPMYNLNDTWENVAVLDKYLRKSRFQLSVERSIRKLFT